MILDEFSAQMKADWNQRARDDAKWYINTYKRSQSDDEFFAQGAGEVEALVRNNLDLLCGDRDPKSLRLLEIGCGIGRMTRHLAPIFGEVVATDVSGEMVERCRQAHAMLENLTCVETSGCDFRAFPDATFDVILSLYVYQHVPSARVIEANLRDAFRVLRPGGVMHFFANGVELGDTGHCDDTWTGAVFPEREVRAVAAAIGAQLVSLRGARHQYMSAFWRKPKSATIPDGALRIHAGREVTEEERLIRLGAWDEVRVWLIVDGMSHEVDDCERVTCDIDGMCVKPSYVGPVRFWPPVRPQALPAIASGARLIELRVPDGVPPGERAVTVRASGDRVSPPHVVQLSLEHRRPLVLSVTNDHDGGIDIHRLGGKSRLRVFSMMPQDTPARSLAISINGSPIPTRGEYLERHGYFLLRGRLPWRTLSRRIRVTVGCGSATSPARTVQLAGVLESTAALLRTVANRLVRGR